MIIKKYSVAIEVAKSPGCVFKRIIDLSKWWIEKFVGEEVKPGSVFILKLGEGHYSKNKVIEFAPDKKFAWITTESKRNTDNFDWTGTKMIFDLRPKGNHTIITFTYDGVVLPKDQEKLEEVCNYCIKSLLYNYLESFTASIEVAKFQSEVFRIITADVSKWWGGKDLSGCSTKLNDEFVVHHTGAHYSKQKLVEVIADKKVVWFVTESVLHWLQNDRQEWTNTKMIFEMSTIKDKTILSFTHQGLVPVKECYEKCAQGWTMVIKDWLFHYITEGKVNERFL